MIVCIPSKGRPHTKTHLLFENVGLTVYHFVEPQEVDLYKQKNIISIGKNNMGIGYSRKFIVNWAKENSHKYIIMCDDDINHFGYAKDGKCIKSDANIFYEIYNYAQKLPFELYGLNFRQFAWSEKNKYSINSKVFTAVYLIKVDKIKWEFNGKMKEDIQFLFDCIKFGNGAMKFNHLFFDCPVVGTNKGGCFDAYQNKEDELVFTSILNKYKGFTKIIKKSNKLDIKWDVKGWAKYHKKTIK